MIMIINRGHNYSIMTLSNTQTLTVSYKKNNRVDTTAKTMTGQLIPGRTQTLKNDPSQRRDKHNTGLRQRPQSDQMVGRENISFFQINRSQIILTILRHRYSLYIFSYIYFFSILPHFLHSVNFPVDISGIHFLLFMVLTCSTRSILKCVLRTF